MPKWTVTGPDGLQYRGVEAPTREDAVNQIQQSIEKRPLTGPPSPFLKQFGELPGRAHQQVQQVPKSVKQTLRETGWSEEEAERKAQDIGTQLAKAPASWWDIAEATVPPLVAALVPAGRTVRRAVGILGANIATHAGIESLKEVVTPTGKGPLGAAAGGSLAALPGGTVQAGVSAIIGPSRATLQAQKAVTDLKKAVSPALSDILDPRRPAAIFSQQTVRAMIGAANQSLDAMETRVSAGLGKQMFTVPISVGKGQTLNAPLPFPEIRTQIKALRDIGDAQYGTPEMRETARKALRAAEELEESLLRQMRQKGFGEIADDYAETLATYKKDRIAIRTVKAVQRASALPGGANPEDFRDLAHMVEDLRPRDLRGAMRAIIGAVFVAKGHPGIGAHYALPGTSKGGFIDPARVAESVGPFRQPGSRILGTAAGLGFRYGQLGPLQGGTAATEQP